MTKDLHDGMPPRLTLNNVAEGHLHALLERELARVAENIADPNTTIKAKRKITIAFEFTPYIDRTGATISTSVKTQTAGMTAIESPMYIAKQRGEFAVYGKNHKQAEMFAAAAEDEEQSSTQKPS